MNNPTPDDTDPEVTLVCYFHYFSQMWVLGTKIIFKAVIGWIMICLMLGLPAILFQFIPVIFVEDNITRQIFTMVAFGIYFLVITPIAFYGRWLNSRFLSLDFCRRLCKETK